MNQTQYDNTVVGLAQKKVDLAIKAMNMHKQDDPDVFRREEELILLQIIYEATRNYDLTWNILEDSEIDMFFEIATRVVENCPI